MQTAAREQAVESGDSPEAIGKSSPRGGLGILGWLITIALAPYFAAALALVAVLVMEALTGIGGARWHGFRQAGAYFVMDGKPPVPRAIPAAYWWVNYALATTVTYGVIVTLVEVVVASAVAVVAEGLVNLWRRVRRRR